ncbi:MAG: DNA polymerase-4, partial [Saprospiraceae bacterium]|jgi:DNA polymerase-4
MWLKKTLITDRKIIHIDMDAFYASVEQRDNPDLRGKPIAVGGSSKRGVVAAASYEARKYGVRSAMASITAARLCPTLIFVKSRFDVYREVSNQIREIFAEYTDLVEPLSLDEAYLDVTNPRKGPNSATLIAEEIRKRIFEKTELTASAGVSFNKSLAKIASDINKPNGLKVILPSEALGFIAQLPISKIHGIGKVTARKMNNMGIRTGGDLQRYDEIDLVQRFGKVGRFYYKMVRAEETREVRPDRIRKSIGAERTFFEDIISTYEMKDRLALISEKVFLYMKKTDNFGRTVSLKIKTPDFQSITRSKTFSSEVRSLKKLKEVVFELLDTNREFFDAARLLGVAVSNLAKENIGEGVQLEFDFEEEE